MSNSTTWVSVVVLVGLLAPVLARAESTGLAASPAVGSQNELRIGGGLFAENFALPGYLLNVERPFATSARSSWMLDVGTGGVFAPPLFHAFFVYGGVAWRLSLPVGFFAEIAFRLGYQHLFNAAPILSFTGGRVVEAPNTGHPMLFGQLPLGGGYDFEKHLGLPVELFFSFGVVVEYPTNAWVAVHWASQVGLRYTLRWGAAR